MNPNAFRSALRMARREAMRNKWRSLLVVLLIGFPVFVLGVGDIAWRSWQLDPSERITREIGAADAGFQAVQGCGNITQVPQGWLGDGYSCGGSDSNAQQNQPTTQTLLASLPPGSSVVERIDDFGGARIKTKVGVKYTDLKGFDYANPLVKGMVKQLHGRAPRLVSEVALTPALAKSINAHIGDTVQFLNPNRSMTVVGIVQDARYRKIETAYSVPSAVDANQGNSETTWFAHTPTPVTWSQVLSYNKQSLVVLSRSVFLKPPPKSQVPFYQQRSGTNHVPAQVIATVTLIAGMALLEVVLLAGPAFAVGARRQRRELALIAAVGGQTRDLRNVVLANGVVLGVIAGVSAALGATLAAFIGIPTLGTLVDQIPGHTDVRPLELAGIACVSLVTALLAAIFPALQAARTDIIAALAGRRGTVRTKRHVPVIGVVIATIGALIAIVGVTKSSSGSTVILIGVVLTEIGLIICTPSLLGLAARFGRLLPLGPRIALRDAGRNRSAATPAVAAVMASMIGAVGILIAVTSAQDQDKRNYVPRLPNHAVFVGMPPEALTGANVPSTSSVEAALKATLPVDSATVVRSAESPMNCQVSGNTKRCDVGGLDVVQNSRVKSRYRGGEFPPVIIDDGSGVNTLFGKAEPAAAAALRAGRAVVPDSSALQADGTIQVGQYDNSGPSGAVDPTQAGSTITLKATVVSDGFAPAAAILPPSALASTTSTSTSIVGVMVTTTRAPTDSEMQAARGRIQALMPAAFVDEETGYHNPSTWALYLMVGIAAIIALGAASIATALANTDGRDDLVTLGAVGASPRTRRVMSMSRAGVVAGLGCLVGVAAGFVPAYAWTRGDRAQLGSDNAALHFVVPWPPILLALLGVPVIASLLAGLVTRSRLPSERIRT